MLHPKYASIFFAIFLGLTACTTMQPLTGDISSQSVSEVFKPGNEIVILTRAGYRHRVKITSIDEDYLVGMVRLEEEYRSSWEERRFGYRDIERIEPAAETGLAEKSGDTAGTVAAAGGAVVVGYALYAVYTAIIFYFFKSLAW